MAFNLSLMFSKDSFDVVELIFFLSEVSVIIVSVCQLKKYFLWGKKAWVRKYFHLYGNPPCPTFSPVKAVHQLKL